MMKYFFSFLLYFFLTNIVYSSSVSFNEKLNRFYILGKIELNDLSKIKKNIERADSIFIRSTGGYKGGEIGKLVSEFKLPVYVGSFCYSACTMITLNSEQINASPETRFMFHDARLVSSDSAEDAKFYQNESDKIYKNAGANNKFFERVKTARKFDKSKNKQAWEIWLRCDELEEYFKFKNSPNCNFYSSKEGITHIVNNNSSIKNLYCYSDKKNKLVSVFFNLDCPEGYNKIKKSKFTELKSNQNILDEFDTSLFYKDDFELGKIDLFIREIERLSEIGITFDFDNLAKKYDYKNFNDALKEYKKKTKVKIKAKQAKKLFVKVDASLKINYSQNNLDKLHDILINNKRLKGNSYFKAKAIPNKAISGCFNLKKALAEITLDPDSKYPELYVWGISYGEPDENSAISLAIKSNKHWVKKYKAPKCDYVVYDLNDTNNLSEEYVKKIININ